MKDGSETKADQRGLKIDLMVEEQISIGVDFISRFSQGHLGVIAAVPLAIDMHIGYVMSTDSAAVMHHYSIQLVGLVGARKVQFRWVDHSIGEFNQAVVLVSKTFEVEL